MMRTTINLEADTFAAAESLRRETGVGISEAVNRLIRQGMTVKTQTPLKFVQRTATLGIRVNIDNTAEIVELLDEADGREQ